MTTSYPLPEDPPAEIGRVAEHLAGMLAFAWARLAEAQAWAIAASAPYPHADQGATVPPGGMHWQWGAGEDWTPVTPDPALDEQVDGGGRTCYLLSVETWTVTYDLGVHGTRTRQAQRSYGTVEELDAAAAGHIVRHDPAAVMRRVACDTAILADVGQVAASMREHAGAVAEQAVWLALRTLARLVAVDREHSDYDPRWALDGAG